MYRVPTVDDPSVVVDPILQDSGGRGGEEGHTGLGSDEVSPGGRLEDRRIRGEHNWKS